MITRAQAEALLTLAESLEACEQLNLDIRPDYDGNQILQFDDTGKEIANLGGLKGMSVRVALSALIPKQEVRWSPEPPPRDVLVNDPDLGIVPSNIQKNKPSNRLKES